MSLHLTSSRISGRSAGLMTRHPAWCRRTGHPRLRHDTKQTWRARDEPRTMTKSDAMAEIRVPTLGESVTEATVARGSRRPGDAVAVDEPLVELETDKVTLEVPAPGAGVLTDDRRQGRRHGRRRRAARPRSGGAGARRSRAASRRSRRAAPRRRRRRRPRRAAPPPPAPPRRAAAPLAPSVRASWPRTARPAAVAGTGKDGRITKGDALAALERAAAQPTPVAPPPPRSASARRRRADEPRAKSACG